MDAATLRHRLQFQEDRGTDNASTGTHTENLVELCTRHTAVFEGAQDGQFTALRALYPGTQSALLLRYDADSSQIGVSRYPVRATWEVNGVVVKIFDVLGTLDVDQRHQELQVAVTQRWPVRQQPAA